MINIEQLTKSYGENKGIFDLSFSIPKGEVFGFIGPNGSGKTTTIRHLLGFIRPDQGHCLIQGVDAYKNAALIHQYLGYIPGELALFNHMRGSDFLSLLAKLRKLKDTTRMNHFITLLDLDVSMSIKKMSKGNRQKLALVAAFMHDAEIYILDEPTSGLDPLMQSVFVDFILEEKKRGKTILMSSHSFDEVERTCDRAGIIKNGRLVALEDIHTLKQNKRQIFTVTVKTHKDLAQLTSSDLDIIRLGGLECDIAIQGDIKNFISVLEPLNVVALESKRQSLESVFMHYYTEETL